MPSPHFILSCALPTLFATSLWLNTAAAAKTSPAPATLPTEKTLQSDLALSSRAWAVGVPEEQQIISGKLLEEANTLLKDSLFKAAIEKYREALTHWDHPGVHYNLALAFINLDEPLLVREHLLKAIAFGAAPLDEKKYEYAKNYLKLIDKQLSSIELDCNESNAIVTLDGNEVLRGPGRYSVVLMPGEHHIIVTKPGYLSRAYHPTLFPGKPEKFTLHVFTEEQLLEKHRRWSFWVPVAVTATGAALVGSGFIALAQGNSKLEKYDNSIKSGCSNVTGCADTKLASLRRAGETYQTLATIGFIGGAAAITGGVVMLYMNTTVTRRMTPEERDRMVTVQPVVTTGFVGAFGTARF